MKKLMLVCLIMILICGCSETEPVDRKSKIPFDAVKITPETDLYPPQLHSDEYEQPVPSAIINTAGAEDSPFIPAGKDEFYFFFTPDVKVPVEKQILDGVTGIYVSKNIDGVLQEPERIMLQKPGKLSLDGCTFVHGDEMLFCTAREGYTGVNWFSAEYKNGKWTDWKEADLPEGTGELHIYQNELYYHSGKDNLDIWMMEKIDGEWKNPKNVEIVNTEENEGWPYITPDGNELWFNRQHLGSPAVFRSKRIDGEWQEPEMIVSQFAGEPTLDKDGNLYLVHHYYDNGKMLEADVYVAYRR